MSRRGTSQSEAWVWDFRRGPASKSFGVLQQAQFDTLDPTTLIKTDGLKKDDSSKTLLSMSPRLACNLFAEVV